jgi:hypothetical protein
VLTAVQLDDDTHFDTGKVTDVSPDRMLSGSESIDLSSPQATPKQALGLGRVPPKGARVAKHPSKGSRMLGIWMALSAT